jgi:hypothetical protein
MTKAVDPNARDARARIGYLAKRTPCRYCGTTVVLAICRDGRWRTFETATVPAAAVNVWAWRKHLGMEETDLVDGHRLHFCVEYVEAHDGVTAFGDLLAGRDTP